MSFGNERELIATLNSKSAQQQREWFKENPEEALYLFWWLIGYAGLRNAKVTPKSGFSPPSTLGRRGK